MHRITTPAGVTVSFDRWGSGPPLVLVHGAFSDHVSNWELVRPLWEDRFTGYAVARRGRGETDAIRGHGLEDEGRDVAAVIRSIACIKAERNCSNASRCGAAGVIACSIRAIQASASAAAEPPPQGSTADGDKAGPTVDDASATVAAATLPANGRRRGAGSAKAAFMIAP